jgi:FdhE protein
LSIVVTHMTQRIRDASDIASHGYPETPRFRLPERTTVFAARAARLRKLADNSPIAGYLRLMAVLVDAQHAVLQTFEARGPSRDAIAHAQAHSMPIVPALTGERDPQWRDVLQRLLDGVERAGLVSPPLAQVIDRLRVAAAAELDAQADAILALRVAEIEPATAPFIMAALQVVWTDLASRTQPADVPYLDEPGACPVCGSAPVASLIRIGGLVNSYRYLQCGLCTNEWNMARVKCSTCDSTKGIAYQGIEGVDAIKAESCDECRSYRKIGYQEKDYDFEPLADDLATLTLDLMMNEAGYRRGSPNPLLWPELPAEADA